MLKVKSIIHLPTSKESIDILCLNKQANRQTNHSKQSPCLILNFAPLTAYTTVKSYMVKQSYNYLAENSIPRKDNHAL